MRGTSLRKRTGNRFIVSVLGIAIGAVMAGGGLEHTAYLSAREPAPVDTVQSALASAPAADTAEVATRTSSTQATTLDVHATQSEHIERWVDRLTTTLKRDFEASLARMSKYGEMITEKLAARQMPKDLVYLAMIESNFNPDAKSPVNAVGLWPFMSGTARQFGLTVGGRVDERKDPEKATDAALTYLSKLHDRFGSWYLAAAAYNSGPGTISKAMRKVTGRTTGTDADFFRILSVLPRETQQYVPKLIASARVGNGMSAE